MKQRIIILLLFIMLTSCEKQTEWALQNSGKNLVVVEGIITDEYKYQTIKLSYPVNSLNEKARPVAGASVVVSNEDSAYIFTERTANTGMYYSNRPFVGHLGKTYSLIINVYNGVLSAKASMVSCSPYSHLTYAKNSSNNLYHVDWVASVFSSGQPAMWELLLNWSHVPGYELSDSSETKARLLFYTLPTLDVSEIFAPEIEQIHFPAGTVITERKYSLTPEHAEFIRELLSVSNWRGGLFDTAPSNITTNLSKGAVGYFAVCSVIQSSITVTP